MTRNTPNSLTGVSQGEGDAAINDDEHTSHGQIELITGLLGDGRRGDLGFVALNGEIGEGVEHGVDTSTEGEDVEGTGMDSLRCDVRERRVPIVNTCF